MAGTWARSALGERGGKLECYAVWLFNKPIDDIAFGWDEVEALRAIRYFLTPGVQCVPKRPVLKGNPGRRFEFFVFTRRYAVRILDHAEDRGVTVDRRVMPPCAR